MFKKAIWPGRLSVSPNTEPVNAGSRRIDVKTTRPGVDFRTHFKRASALAKLV